MLQNTFWSVSSFQVELRRWFDHHATRLVKLNPAVPISCMCDWNIWSESRKNDFDDLAILACRPPKHPKTGLVPKKWARLHNPHLFSFLLICIKWANATAASSEIFHLCVRVENEWHRRSLVSAPYLVQFRDLYPSYESWEWDLEDRIGMEEVGPSWVCQFLESFHFWRKNRKFREFSTLIPNQFLWFLHWLIAYRMRSMSRISSCDLVHDWDP